jgi:CRISPR-associated protein Csx10
MKAITFVVSLEEPFLATQVNNGEPNSGISYPFIPGSMIRGALIGKYLKEQSGDPDLAANERSRALFFTGQVRFLNAYLYDAARNLRLLPKPRSWFVEKGSEDDDQATIADFAVKPNHQRGKQALENPKPPKGSFTRLINDQPLLCEPDYHVTVHNTTDEPGKKKEGISQMYRYEALAPGQTFQGAILADDDMDVSDLKKWLKDTSLTLGGSSSGGYGLVTVSDVAEVNDWQETPAEPPLPDCHILTCLSDVIVRSKNGQVAATMAEALDVDPAAVTAFQDVRVVGGFNQKWGLPLPQAWVIQAGSVFRVAAGAITRDELAKRIQGGVGERTAEGFGRLALNWHTRADRQRFAGSFTTTVALADEVEGYGRTLATQMANRRLRLILERKLQEKINQHKGAFKSLPSATQLSRVRLAARHALARQNITGIANHMNGLKGARSQWQGAKIGKDDLSEWIKRHSKLDATAFQTLFDIQGKLPKVANVTAILTTEMITEYSARLIDGVMKLAIEKAKADKEKSSREGKQ